MKKIGVFSAILAIAFGFFIALSLCVEVLTHQEVFSVQSSMKIVIDAGHGGIDGGVTGINTGIKESDLNLDIALRLAEKLRQKGFEAVLTRKTKEGLYDTTKKGFKRRDMEKRKQIIAQENPALVLSIHQNYYASKGQRGGQVFYLEGENNGEKLADNLQGKLNALYEKEGVKARKKMAADYFILSCAPCPSALIECGFLSSPKDETLLCSDDFLEELTESICTGVVGYLFSQA